MDAAAGPRSATWRSPVTVGVRDAVAGDVLVPVATALIPSVTQAPEPLVSNAMIENVLEAAKLTVIPKLLPPVPTWNEYTPKKFEETPTTHA